MKKMLETGKKRVRTFSPSLKKEKVKMIEEGQVTVLQISRLYEVSRKAVYTWIKQYGKLPPTERFVVEKKSEAVKNIELLNKIEKLERVIGQQQVKIQYKEKVIELGSELLGKDIEKKYNIRPLLDS